MCAGRESLECSVSAMDHNRSPSPWLLISFSKHFLRTTITSFTFTRSLYSFSVGSPALTRRCSYNDKMEWNWKSHKCRLLFFLCSSPDSVVAVPYSVVVQRALSSHCSSPGEMKCDNANNLIGSRSGPLPSCPPDAHSLLRHPDKIDNSIGKPPLTLYYPHRCLASSSTPWF